MSINSIDIGYCMFLELNGLYNMKYVLRVILMAEDKDKRQADKNLTEEHENSMYQIYFL